MKVVDLTKQIENQWDNTWVQCVRAKCSTSEEPAVCEFSHDCWHARPHKVKRCRTVTQPCRMLGVSRPGFCSIITKVETPYEP